MRATSRILGTCCVIGFGGALLYVLASRKTDSASIDANAQIALATPIGKPDAAPSPPSTTKDQESWQASQPTPNEDFQSLLAEAQRLATDYAASFVPGVYGDEPTPGFAAPLLGINAAGSKEDLLCTSDLSCYAKYLRDYPEYRRGLTDDWSAEMARRLRSFFESSPEFTNTRVAVSCRASQCKVQMIEVYEVPDVQVPSQGKSRDTITQRMFRLRQEAWFRDNFTYTIQVSNEMRDIPFQSRRILHMLFTLQRRDDDDKSRAQ